LFGGGDKTVPSLGPVTIVPKVCHPDDPLNGGVHLAQDSLLAPPSRHPLSAVRLPTAATQWLAPEAPAAPGTRSGPPVTDFLQLATVLGEDATAVVELMKIHAGRSHAAEGGRERAHIPPGWSPHSGQA
jgi:hypothetical protein